VRRSLAGLATILLAFAVNQVSALLDFSWGVYAAVASAVIGYGLLLTAGPTRRFVWSGLGRTHPLDIVLAVGLITGVLGSATAWFLIKQEETRASKNLVRNGGFESGTEGWGTYTTSGSADSHGTLDTTERHSGIASFRFEYRSPKASDSWGALSQRIGGLRPRTSYAATFWALVSKAEPEPLFLTADPQAAVKTQIERVSGWREYRLVFNTGDADHVDLRFVIEAPAVVWIDDVVLHEHRQ